MRRGGLVLAAALLLVGCARLRRPAPPLDESEPTRMVGQANELARSDSPRDARKLYREVIRLHPRSPAAADALYGLGRLYVDPKTPLTDYAAAQVAFGRLLAEHPDSPHVAEARAWQAALAELLRNQAEARRLRADLERLKQLDMEQEKSR